MNLHVPVPHFQYQFITTPTVAGLGARVRCKISQKTSSIAVHLTKCCEIPIDGVREPDKGVPVGDYDGSPKRARDVKSNISVHGLGVKYEGMSMLPSMYFGCNPTVGSFHLHENPLGPLRGLHELFWLLNESDVGANMPIGAF